MCGIVGYTGFETAAELLVNGLKRLEYRGYDSAGIALESGARPEVGASAALDGREVLGSAKIDVVRCVGKVAGLECELAKGEHGAPIKSSTCGIGHTRWATHGSPTVENAHPHVSCDGRIAVVHNGIIENFAELRASLEERGHVFRSETDTEVFAHLIEEAYQGAPSGDERPSCKGDFMAAVREACTHTGSPRSVRTSRA